MLEKSIYSVISPEAFASILWKDSSRADEAAETLIENQREHFLISADKVANVFESNPLNHAFLVLLSSNDELTTVTDEKAIASPANSGLSSRPK